MTIIDGNESTRGIAHQYFFVKNANANYERELALHAEARAALRDARSGIESEQRLRGTIEAQPASAQSEIEAEKVAWESLKKKLTQVET